MNDERQTPPTRRAPDPRIVHEVARRMMELGIMQEDVHSPGADVPTPEELTELLPDHEVEALIGKGGMGAVYRARQTSLDRAVALKVLVEPVADAGFAERFQREAQALASLSHPGIVSVYDFGRAGDYWYLTMELVDGTDLRRVIDGRSVTPRESLSIVSQVCEALQYAHDKGVVHRDIKPGNVLLDRDGRVRITDFGLAKMTGQRPSMTLTRASQVMGTPHYMAPEQMETPLAVDHRADLYSVGVVLYELLTGELPMGNFALPSQRMQVDVRLDEVVLRALEREPPKRYQSASAVRSDVDEVVKNPRAPETAEASRAPGSRSLVVAWSVAATFAFLALAIGLGLGGPQGAAGEEPVQAVTMLDLTGEEDGRAVTWTVEYDEAGAPRLAPRFVQAFGMEADAVSRAEAHLASQRRAYEALVDERARAVVSTLQDRVQVQVEDFALDREDLVAPTLVLLRGELGGRELPAEAAQLIERRLFPLGRGRSNLQLEGSAPTLQVNTEQGSYELEGEQARREFGFLLGGMRARPSMSLLPALRAVAASVEGLDWEGWELELVECMGASADGGSSSVGGLGGGEMDLPGPLACRLLTAVEYHLTPPAAIELRSLEWAELMELQRAQQARVLEHLRGLTSLGGLELSNMTVQVEVTGGPDGRDDLPYVLKATVRAIYRGSWAGAPLSLEQGDLGAGGPSTLHAALAGAGLGDDLDLSDVETADTRAPGFLEQRTIRMRATTDHLSGSTRQLLDVLESVEAGGELGILIALQVRRGILEPQPGLDPVEHDHSLSLFTTFQDRRAFEF